MINQPQSERFSRIIRKLFVFFLIFTFIVTTGSFILRHTITTKLDRLSNQLQQPWQQPAINRLLVDLNLTENRFQQASANGQISDLETYKNHLKDIFAKIEKIIQWYKVDGNSKIPKSKQQIALALQQKIAVSQQLFDLQKRFTSLLENTTLASIKDRSAENEFGKRKLQIDTSVSVYKEPTKRSLIKRLKDAVENTTNVKVLTIKQPKNSDRVEIQPNQNDLLRTLGQQYARLGQSNQEMILANLNLLTELRQLLLDVQGIERIAYEQSREKILEEYQSTSRDLNTFTGIASFFILIFIIILIFYIREASGAERRYIMENSRAVRLAGQKSEILAIMSHEIRNKLMAINGAVFMLKRTTLLPEQEKKVISIDLSSFLLLETVNNVLDVSKLEQSAAELKINPFTPYQAISDSVEAMRFMAERKGINLNFEFEGVKDLTINGDDLRLKQVLINLLSNAIKFTDKGYVSLSAQLQEKGNAFLLVVMVKDTGSGIPKNKQAGLFTPYYQAGGHKQGTGLGLYLCRQLVRLQGGEIEIESDEGKGCVVSFSIPY
ncbi:sensor histidine kinase [Pedobacter mucosus]|uniref:sensor histidine kinase n=1 Tax=Pedobacter mucosus TaxID=2895286 RepID=UPI001EE45393|nr:HAMP domain-containing sensor histidine kinase [Pedobacter mucosus]UKT62151.1 HAMP domain-containing histidine kinase [Pedobacter mucosus]